MKRPALILFALAMLFGSPRSPRALTVHAPRPLRPSYDVRITPTSLPSGSTSIDIGPTLWSLQGYDLRGLLAHIYGVESSRVDLHDPAPGAEPERFDISVPLAGDESDATVQKILEAAVRARFHLVASLETRSVEVYVLTAPNGAGPGLLRAEASRARMRPIAFAPAFLRDDSGADGDASSLPQSITVAGRVCPGVSSAGISATAATVEALARVLEGQLDRPIVDETHLTDAYDFQIPEYRSREQLFALLHEKLGIEISVTRRSVAILAVRSTAQVGASNATLSRLDLPTF
ncbi:MAG: TIGR03435 family protein [Acidobacteriota bacterium]|nr:TIGR03435 family protein [Acidobacteriota bacterium]